jgi:hypothetical protein
MTPIQLPVVALLALLTNVAHCQTPPPAASESRDAATAYIGTANFVVGRIGRDCLSLTGRTETPQAFVAAWQQRNMKYLTATQTYMEARFVEAEALGGAELRSRIAGALTSAVRTSAEAAVKLWLDRPDKNEACKRTLMLIESGSYDISPTSPMFSELEGLVAWAKR